MVLVKCVVDTERQVGGGEEMRWEKREKKAEGGRGAGERGRPRG